jgi:endonuclease/exonuclease/phosphatase family metal-dependent hydrolase
MKGTLMRKTPIFLTTAAVVATGLAAIVPSASAAETGTFKALTYNVAGLPAGISSAKTPRGPASKTIGERLRAYDIVNVQEDFNFHKDLYSTANHPNRTPTSGGVPFGSGLNTVSNFPFTGLQRERWDDCDSGSGDCLTPKGYTFVRVTLDDGVDVDFYNLHTDAGVTDGDLAARRSNLAQVSAAITANSTGNAVVVMGDTNTRYTRDGDDIATFASDNGLTDAWIEHARGGVAPTKGSPALLCDENTPTNTCEVVDKILYRGGTSVNLKATAYNNDHAAFRNADGVTLSDHSPISATFSWTKN